ncbi:MAG: hypothetical protein KDB14_25760 [Planctomycetales bacterium]|nr:hypothetical protein [Planctomycetales bacterium]
MTNDQQPSPPTGPAVPAWFPIVACTAMGYWASLKSVVALPSIPAHWVICGVTAIGLFWGLSLAASLQRPADRKPFDPAARHRRVSPPRDDHRPGNP